MRQNPRILIFIYLALVCAGTGLGVDADQGGRGKFYIVGMGTAPDLITIRGVQIIKSADVVLIGNERERE